jgi:hypothetical protein
VSRALHVRSGCVLARTVLPLFAFLVPACAVVTSLDGLTSGPADAGAGGEASPPNGVGVGDSGGIPPGEDAGTSSGGPDGAPDGNVADSVAPPKDSAVTDGSGPSDTSADSTTTDTGPSPFFCGSLSPQPLFCDDFDQGPVTSLWDQLTSRHGTATLSTTSPFSAPDSMLVTVNPNVGGIDCAGYKSFYANQGVLSTYTVTVEMRVDAADTTSASDAILLAMQLWNGNTSWDLQLELSFDSASSQLAVDLSENATPGDGGPSQYTAHPLGVHLPLETWTKVAMAVNLTSTPNTAKLFVNDVAVGSTVVSVITPDPIPEILVGVPFAVSSSTGWVEQYDNVTFTSN